MQRYNIKRNIVFILIFSLFELFTYSQTSREVREFAENSFTRGQYSVALKEYQRLLYFSDDKSDPYLFKSIADCYFQVGDLERALEFYDRAYFLFQSDSMLLSTLFDRIACHVFQNHYNLALIDMYSLPDSLPTFFDKRRHFYLGIIHFGKEDFETSKKHFISINQSNESYVNKVNELFDSKGKINKPNPKTAFILSLIVPGSGQLYAGDIKNGINSFVLNEGLLLLGIYTAYRYTILDALISVGPWFQRYYQGGLTSAEAIAEQKRYRHRQQIFKKTLELVEEHSKK